MIDRPKPSPVDLRITAAQRHCEAADVANSIAGPLRKERVEFCSFLSGWDAAMEARFPELLEESTELHGRLLEIEADLPATVAEIVALRSLARVVEAIVEKGECDGFWMEALGLHFDDVLKARPDWQSEQRP